MAEQDILSRLKAGKAAISEVPFGDILLAVRTLTEADRLEAGFAADALWRTRGVEFGVGTADLYESELANQLLLRAVIDPETRQPVFKTAGELRDTLSREQKIKLMEASSVHERAFNPSERNLSEAEFSALLDEVKKNPATIRLDACSFGLLKKLITVLAVAP